MDGEHVPPPLIPPEISTKSENNFHFHSIQFFQLISRIDLRTNYTHTHRVLDWLTLTARPWDTLGFNMRKKCFRNGLTAQAFQAASCSPKMLLNGQNISMYAYVYSTYECYVCNGSHFLHHVKEI